MKLFTKTSDKKLNTNRRSGGGGGNFSCRHPKLWSYIKSNVKAFFITGAITFVVSVSATTILHSRQVRYKNDKSVETTINELYQKAYECELKKLGCINCTRVNYLESTGTQQYIDTEIIPNQTIKTVIDFETKNDVATDRVILGLNENGNRLYSMGWENGKVYFGYNGWYWAGYTVSTNTRYKVESQFTNGLQKHFVNNQLITETNNTVTSLWSYSIYLFANHNRTTASNNGALIKLYSCQIYNNDILVRDYIPVLDANGRSCLFDKVSKECFYNQGTGEFLYG